MFHGEYLRRVYSNYQTQQNNEIEAIRKKSSEKYTNDLLESLNELHAALETRKASQSLHYAREHADQAIAEKDLISHQANMNSFFDLAINQLFARNQLYIDCFKLSEELLNKYSATADEMKIFARVVRFASDVVKKGTVDSAEQEQILSAITEWHASFEPELLKQKKKSDLMGIISAILITIGVLSIISLLAVGFPLAVTYGLPLTLYILTGVAPVSITIGLSLNDSKNELYREHCRNPEEKHKGMLGFFNRVIKQDADEKSFSAQLQNMNNSNA